jgi:hypothetical protein
MKKWREAAVKCFFFKKKMVLFPTYKKNDWKTVVNALIMFG